MAEKKQELNSLPSALLCFEKYSKFEPVNKNELDVVINYICGHLNANYTMNYPYWYDMYSYTTKTRIVLRHRREHGKAEPLAKLGECVCQGKVINFLKNPDKKCFCNSGCASVYYNKVF